MVTSTGTQLADFEFIEWQDLYDVEKPYEIFIQLSEEELGLGSRTNLVFRKHSNIPVEDLRGRESELALDVNGFQLLNAPTLFDKWSNRTAVESEYMKECADILRKSIDDVDFIYFYNWRLRDSRTGNLKERRKINLNNPTDPLNPAVYPHIDESDVGSRLRVQAYFGNEAADLLQGRLRVINMWRPIQPVEDFPLALADARSFTMSNLVASDNIRSNFQGETFFGKYTPDYKWNYLSDQQPNEVTMFKIHDSSPNVTAKRIEPSWSLLAQLTADFEIWIGTLHAAFKLRNPPPNALPRRSIEMRALVFSKPPNLRNSFPHPIGRVLYGTAWKKDRTAECTFKAIENGFRAFDTACQPRSYREDLVGVAIRKAFVCGIFKSREEIWIQSKFTPPSGHDPENLPYDLDASISDQVHASIANSLYQLRHKEELNPKRSNEVYLDSLLLHAPFPDFDDTLIAWNVMASYVPHRIRAIGVSNMPLKMLQMLFTAAEVKPSYVQNRFVPQTLYEAALRRFCRLRNIGFQAIWVLKGKTEVLESTLLEQVAESLGNGTSKEIALYLLVLSLGDYMTVVIGTESAKHMEEDIDALSHFQGWLSEADNTATWNEYIAQFRCLIRESWGFK